MEEKARPQMKQVYVGAKSIVCPLGDTPAEVFKRMLEGQSGLRLNEQPFGLEMSPYLGQIPERYIREESMDATRLENLLSMCLENSVRKLAYDPFVDDRGLVIICTTKGNIDHIDNPDDARLPLHRLSSFLQYQFRLSRMPMVLSNACISGLAGIITAARLIRSGEVKHVLVLGGDLVSKFTLAGFASLKALADGQCQPYDAQRTGINLGEAAAGLVLSADRDLFKGRCVRYIGGAITNDANHISGPSRTGEGLYRAITRAMAESEVEPNDVAYISAHGTGTSFNDEMESIALDRAGLSGTPVNSLKGYLGHTLGAAGVIETLLGLEAMKQGKLLPSMGYTEHGVSKSMNIITYPKPFPEGAFLKTASGFGGGNAAAIFSALSSAAGDSDTDLKL
jgi:3-oxoacyl-[acyl-carrier-protein] synthase I